ncbi:vesicle coat component [Orbilia brochopaga]|uniref:Protein transport protein sec16 n=1 Tax=Orbilia brochopaga TaxID=3140254 RepID=A0AAV9UMA0_9PEZI
MASLDSAEGAGQLPPHTHADAFDPSTTDDASFFDHLGIPRANDPSIVPPATLPNPQPADEAPEARDTTPTIIHHDSGDRQPAMPRLDSDDLITTCHVEDINVGCLECQAKSAERSAAGEHVTWETIHQEHLHKEEQDDEDDSEGGLEIPVRRPSQPAITPIPETTSPKAPADVPDTKDPFDGPNDAEDPFEQLKHDPTLHTSASFPAVPNPQTGDAGATENPFGNDSPADDSFFGSIDREEKPVEPSDANFFGDEGASGDDFFSNVDTNGNGVPTFERSTTEDAVMGGNVELEGEDNRFGEGMPLFGDQEGATEDDFFSRSRTPIDPISDEDDDAAFFDNPTALKRKSTAMAAGIPETGEKPKAEQEVVDDKPKADMTLKWAAALDDEPFLDEDEEEEEEQQEATVEGTAANEQKPAAPAWFDDSEDFLLEDDESKKSPPAVRSVPPSTQPSVSSRYTPTSQPYTPAPPAIPAAPAARFPSTASPYAAAFQQPSRATDAPKAQSFVDKTTGYHSPYDLPEDIVKPIKKKPTPVQQPPPYGAGHYYGQHGAINTPPSAQFGHSALSPAPGGLASPADITRGRPGYGGQPAPPPPGPPSRTGASPAPNAVPPKPLRSQSSGFFEELPVTLPQRPPSGASGRYTPGGRASSTGPQGLPPTSAPISMNRTASMTGPPSRPTSVEPGFGSPPVGSLGAPHSYGTSPGNPSLVRTSSPYTPAPPPPANSNYAPKPSPSTSLYASPPRNVRGVSPYAQRPNVPPTIQPRSSSMSSESRYGPAPGGHDAAGLGISGTPEGMGANGYAQTGRPPSRDRPSTMESMKAHALGGVAEEDEEGNAPASSAFDKSLPPPPVAAANRYNPANRQTPPPPGSTTSTTNPALAHLSSPPTRSQSPGKYTPANHHSHTATSSLSSTLLSPTEATAGGGFAPPKRSATQSPGFAAFRSANVHGIQRPNSAAASHAAPGGNMGHSPVDTRRPSYPVQNAYPSTAAPTPQNFMAPPPGSLAAQDPLERWKGSPLFCWGFGGNVVTMFPVHTSRWNAETGQQVIKTSLGEVKNRPAKELLRDDDFFEDLGKFPGPVFGGKAGGKGRKKEISAWMESKILKLEGEYTRYRDPRSMEKVILWKLVKLCMENDGTLAGKPEIDAAVRQIISPESDTLELPRRQNALQQSTVFDRNALETIRTHLMKGDREAAVWFAIENRQWAHAILISSTTSPELYKRTVQEFVKTEVKNGETTGMEAMAVLYEVFAGNWEESIDDLVPASTRMGMTMMSTTGGQSGGNTLEGLEKWRETLGLMLGNRSNGDFQAIAKLGSLLESYNRIEAAHICYLFAMPAALFSGAEETSKTIFALLGANHVNDPFNYGRDLDAIILSEIYEFALSLLPGAPPLTSFPHLLPFKLHHAQILAQYGFKAESQRYADAITASFKLTSRPQPYLHPLLLAGIDELSKRLSQAPRDSSGGSWMSKPTLDTISGSLLNTFNRFVTGDSEDTSNGAPAGEILNGGIGGAGINGGLTTPGLSREQSGVDLYGSGIGMGGYAPYTPGHHQPALGSSPAGPRSASSAASSRYAPKVAATPTLTGGYTPQLTGQPKAAEPTAGYAGGGGYGGYEPTPTYGGYGGYESEKPQEHSAANGHAGYQPSPVPSAPLMSPPSMDTSYATFSPPTVTTGGSDDKSTPTGGYEPPNAGGGYGGYEPPTNEFQPYVPSPDNSDDEGEGKKKAKSKKKGIMDDDDDGFVGGGGGGGDDAAKKKKEEEEAENRKMVEAIAKKEAEEAERKKKAGKSGGWFGSWFGGKKDPNAPVVHTAKLGEESSFYYDPDLKKWVNKKAGAGDSAGPTPTGTPPPPKRLGSPAQISGPPSAPPSGIATPQSHPAPPPPSTSAPPTSNPGGLMPPPPSSVGGSRDPSPNRPPTRPSTTGKVDEMEELLGGTGSVRKGGAKAKGRKRYVEVL